MPRTASERAEAVPSEATDVTPRVYAALAAGNMDAVLELVDPPIELEIYTGRPDLPETLRLHGHSGFVENLSMLAEVFEQMEVRPVEYVEAGDHLIVTITTTGRGKGSGIRVENTVVHVWTIRDGKAIRFRVYGTKQEALDAVAQEPVEIVREVVEALGRNDYERAAARLHPEAEWHNTDAFPGAKSCHGPQQITVF